MGWRSSFGSLVLVAALALASALCPLGRRSVGEVHARSHPLDLLPPRRAPVGVAAPEPAAARPPDVFLVIGVKTRVLRGLEARQAIRQTWGGRVDAERLGVRTVFLGCEPDLSPLEAGARRAGIELIEQEKAEYGDFLTAELQCMDSFFTLVDKILAFLSYADDTFPTSSYAMIVDDDVYIRLDRLVTLLRSDQIPAKQFYGGNNVAHLKPTFAIRHAESRYFLPRDVYPMKELPRFVAGAHYVLSRDIVRFVARNRRKLRGLQGLDDATMAFWVLALNGIQPRYIATFQILRSWNCTEDLISYADLSPLAIREAHSSLVLSGSLCSAFNMKKWLRDYQTITFAEFSEEEGVEDKGDVRFDWDLELDQSTSLLQILVKVTVANQSVQLPYFPAAVPYKSGFCAKLLPLMEAKLSIVVGTNFCRKHRNLLLNFLREHDLTKPSPRPLLTLARHNLAQDASDDVMERPKPVVKVLTIGSINRAEHVVVECLMALAYRDNHVDFVDKAKTHSNIPDVVVVMNQHFEIVQNIVAEYRHRHSRLILLRTEGELSSAPPGILGDVILIGSAFVPLHSHRHVPLPQASAAFGGSINHSPISLIGVPVPIDAQPRSFCVSNYAKCDSPILKRVISLLRDIDDVDSLGTCHQFQSTSEETSPTSGRSPTLMDDMIEVYRRYKFVVAFDDADTNGAYQVNERIAMAFVAGSIPIYYGDSQAVSRLFNPEAFVHCGKFESVEACVKYVEQLHCMPSLYASVRKQPPVVNKTAFVEAFSWHPAVAEMGLEGDILIGDRLQHLLLGETISPS